MRSKVGSFTVPEPEPEADEAEDESVEAQKTTVGRLPAAGFVDFHHQLHIFQALFARRFRLAAGLDAVRQVIGL